MACFALSTKGYFAHVDEADLAPVTSRRWRLERHRNYFRVVGGHGRGGVVTLATFLLGPQRPGCVIDHISGNTLDNRRANLRVCTRNENAINRRPWGASGKIGVTWNKQCQKWQVGLKSNGISYYLGVYDCLDDAASAYDRKAAEMHGKFARLNKDQA